MRMVCWGLLAASLVGCAVGCGPGTRAIVPVNGIVTMDDKAMDNARVTFYAEKGGIGGVATTGTDGKFIVLAGDGKGQGLEPGKFKVTVSKMKIPGGGGGDPPVGAITEAEMKDDLPAIYSSPGQTVLSYTVTGDGKPIEIKLDSKRKK
jgi:hypothetical protein